MDKLNTNYKYITILNTKYIIKSPTLLIQNPMYPNETIDIRHFNWKNIDPSQIKYSN